MESVHGMFVYDCRHYCGSDAVKFTCFDSVLTLIFFCSQLTASTTAPPTTTPATAPTTTAPPTATPAKEKEKKEKEKEKKPTETKERRVRTELSYINHQSGFIEFVRMFSFCYLFLIDQNERRTVEKLLNLAAILTKIQSKINQAYKETICVFFSTELAISQSLHIYVFGINEYYTISLEHKVINRTANDY